MIVSKDTPSSKTLRENFWALLDFFFNVRNSSVNYPNCVPDEQGGNIDNTVEKFARKLENTT